MKYKPYSFKQWLKIEKGFNSLTQFNRFIKGNGQYYEYYYYLSYSEYLKEVLEVNSDSEKIEIS